VDLPAAFPAATVEEYTRAGWWGTDSLADMIARNATAFPDRLAYAGGDERLTWAGYWERARRTAAGLSDIGIRPGDRVAVQLPDSPTLHVAYLALELIGAVVVGIGMRAGQAEIEHVMRLTEASRLLREGELPEGEAVPFDAFNSRLGPNDVFLINSTSGTTGLPKCVKHTQNRWLYWVRLVVASSGLNAGDVMFSLVPTPLGFGLWSAHFSPAVAGAGTIRLPRFDAADALEVIERERPTLAAAVTTQFILMLNHPSFRGRDLRSLRALYRGGEAIPFDRAVEWEEATGSEVLQFYGSNEAGALSCTRLGEPRDRRLLTNGRVIPEMQVQLFAGGQPGCKGPSVSAGYLGDESANRQLYTDDGWVLTGDRAELDAEGYLKVVGRIADFIIRGGYNISAAHVEQEVSAHPAVAHAAVVGMPDPVFGERVCAYVELKPGASLELAELTAFLAQRGNSKQTFPERLETVTELPLSSGGKVAKQALRDDIARKVAVR
jgi:acyl-CoA synthetase